MRSQIGFLSGFVTIALLIAGCASRSADWFRIYDARAEMEALRSAPEAEAVPTEIEAAGALLDKAETALEKERYAEVAQIAELVLLRIERARVVARRKRVRRELQTTQDALEQITQQIDIQRKELQKAQAELQRLDSDSSAGVPAPD